MAQVPQQTDALNPKPDEGVPLGALSGELLNATVHSEAAALSEVYQRFHETEAIPLEHIAEDGTDSPHILIVPAGKRAISLKPFRDQYLTRPERQRGIARFTELASFVSHVKRTKTEDTVLFAEIDVDDAKIVAVYDYNAPGHGNAPGWQQHRAEYSFPFSDEWKAWKEQEGEARAMSMQKFAEFLERRVMDVALPAAVEAGSLADKMQKQLEIEFASPSRLLQISKNISINQTDAFVEAVDLQGGAKNFSFKQKNTDAAGAPFKIEGGFLIRIPVFRGDKSWIIPVQLRYRNNGGVRFFYDVYRMDMHFYESVKAACELVNKETELEVLMGSPELDGGE